MIINSYNQMLSKFREIFLLESMQSLLYWDLNTMLPNHGLDFRIEQFSWIQKEIHKRWVCDDLFRIVNSLNDRSSFDNLQLRNIELIEREIENRTALPTDLVSELSSQSNKTLEVWKKAKFQNRFKDVLPDLKRLFDLNMKRAEIFAEIRSISNPYEALINFRDPGISIKLIKQFFNELKSFLIPFLNKIQNNQIKSQTSFLNRKISKSSQIKLLMDLANFLGYNNELGRIDEVEHPLTITCGPNDVRVTVKYHENRIMSAFFACMHEIGHALSRLQKNPKWEFQPVNYFGSPSFNESQSRFLENIVGLSKEFWHAYYQRFQELSENKFYDIDIDQFYFAINQVQPGFIRIDSDELTYCLHIIIRFEIEYDLFRNKLDIEDLPTIWNEKYKDYLGIDVPNDTQGVLQDLHFYSQYWGYFYGYTLGDIINSQIVNEGLSVEVPNWYDTLKNGNFTIVREWLAKNIHQKGFICDTPQLVEKITGKPLTTNSYLDYLRNKYTEIYNL